MSLYDSVRDLPLTVEGYDLEGLEQQVSSGFLRKTTIIRLHGAGEEGVGEDVTYEATEHDLSRRSGPILPSPATGRSTRSRSISRRCRSSITSPSSTPTSTTGAGRTRARRSTSRCARRAARSATPSAGQPQPLTFVVSMRLGEPPTTERAPAPGSRSTRDSASSSTRRPTGRTS